MKFNCLKSNLDPLLQMMARIVSPRPTLPVLNNVLLKVSGKDVTLSATNLDIGITAHIGAKVSKEGAITLPAKLLAEFVSSVPEDLVEFDMDGALIKVSSGNYQASFNGIESDEFPENPSLKNSEKMVLNAKALVDNIPLVSFSAASDEARPVITGVMTTIDNKEMILVAADGYRLAERKVPLGAEAGEVHSKLIIPARNLTELQRMLSGASNDEFVEVSYDDNQVVFTYKDIQLVSRLLVGQYPDYKQIIPKQFKTSAVVNKNELGKAVKVASLFAKDSALVIHLDFDQAKQMLIITASSSQVGENTTSLPCKITGENNKISYNARYVLDFLSVCDTSEVLLEVNDPLGPGVLAPHGEETGGYTYVIMPIRT